MDKADLEELFKLLDADGNGQLTLKEVLDGILQLRSITEDKYKIALIRAVPSRERKFDTLGRFCDLLPEAVAARLELVEEQIGMIELAFGIPGAVEEIILDQFQKKGDKAFDKWMKSEISNRPKSSQSLTLSDFQSPNRSQSLEAEMIPPRRELVECDELEAVSSVDSRYSFQKPRKSGRQSMVVKTRAKSSGRTSSPSTSLPGSPEPASPQTPIQVFGVEDIDDLSWPRDPDEINTSMSLETQFLQEFRALRSNMKKDLAQQESELKEHALRLAECRMFARGILESASTGEPASKSFEELDTDSELGIEEV
jgi:hypothetical protein